MQQITRNILLNPGPATTTDTVKMAQVVPDICPREREFASMMAQMRTDLVRIVHGDLDKYTAVLFCGSGTINIDICLNSLLPEGKKVLVINNGAYSARAAEICEYYDLPVIELVFPVDALPDLEKVEIALRENPDIALVHTTHNETGTGILNPIREIGALAHQYGAVFTVDTTSTYAMRPIDIERDNIDFCMASAQKGLMAMTGLSFIIGNRAFIEKSAEYPKRSYYCNLYLQYHFFETTGEMHFTPPVQTIYAARQALDEYFAEGEQAKWQRHLGVFEAIHAGLDRLGFQDIIKRELQAGLVVSVRYPDDVNWDFEKVHDYCYERGFTIYPGKVSTQNTFRLCALGAITAKDIEAFFVVFEEALRKYGVQIPIRYIDGRRKVYTCFCTDVIHEGHLNLLREAAKYGEVTVGILSDEAMIKYNRFPTITIEERKQIVRDTGLAQSVVIQNEIMYDKIIAELSPDYVIHGDNWCEGPERAIRENVLQNLAKYGGELIEVAYTRNERVRKIDDNIRERLSMPEYRRRRLRQLIKLCPVVKTIEVHSGLTGLIAEKTIVAHNGELDQFDAMWLSSLCDSTAKGKPDIELVDLSSRLRTIDDVMEVTTKPIILDGDTGGLIEHFVYNVRTLERMGVSAVIIEDKTGLKKNSLFGTDVAQTQDSIENFCNKIRAGKNAQRTEEFMIIARIESLILEKGQEDALRRAAAYVEAGADAVMIHSRQKSPAEIFEFCDRFRRQDKNTPLVVVPTSFNSVTEAELAQHGVNIVIYANQLTRSAFPVMQSTAVEILKNHRALEVDAKLMPFQEIITLIDDM